MAAGQSDAAQRRIRVLCHNIRSLHNVGSLFRTGDAFGVEHIYLTGFTGYPPRREIEKVALGAEQWIPWSGQRDPTPFLKECRSEGFHIVALEQTPEAHAIESYQPPDNLCLVLGHEVDGIPEELLCECDEAVRIPMHGKKESLNVSVAAGIALHHARTTWIETPAQ